MLTLINKYGNAMTRVTESATGQTFWFCTSDFCGGCWHVFLDANQEAHVCNYFTDKQFWDRFEPFNKEKCNNYIHKIKNF